MSRQSFTAMLQEAPALGDLEHLPDYGFVFFFRNMGPFRASFILLTVCKALSSVLRFVTVYLLGDILSSLTTLSTDQIFYYYLPVWLGSNFLAELLEYFIRRYAEAFPAMYGDYLSLRFYRSFFDLDFQRLYNFSKERLLTLVGKYTGHVQGFLADWFWGTTSRAVRLVLVLAILYAQNPWILAINACYVALFLVLSLRVSRAFSPIAERYAKVTLRSSEVTGSFTMSFNAVKRLGIRDFFLNVVGVRMAENWKSLAEVREFHARRWLLQLNLFNFLYIATLVYGVYQVKQGSLALGFLVLIKWAFDELWGILVYVIEYYVSLVQQREDAKVVREEFAKLAGKKAAPGQADQVAVWREMELSDVRVHFPSETAGKGDVSVVIPQLRIARGDKLGVIGESGAGKTTLLNVLLRLVPIDGKYVIDGREVSTDMLHPRFVTVISNHDPLFKISLEDNILLGRKLDSALVQRVLEGVKVRQFISDLSAQVGAAGFNLSAGQEQRIRLARGLLQQSDIYLLDEPFNGIDEGNKQEIIEFLKEHLREKTVVLVTHNSNELKLVEEIYSFRDGVLQPA